MSEIPEKSAAYRTGGLTLFFATGIILVALAFEHLGGYTPCPLCLMQRYAYYAAIPLLFVAMALTSEMPRLAAFLYVVVALAFLGNAGLGVYHAGAEWKFWPGPTTCGAAQSLPTSASDLLSSLAESRVVRCDEAPWTFAGLSFAGWNVVASLAAFTGALKAAFLSASVRD
ncbi:disulfide bond formation protein B [Hyphomicrobium nitrativorans]|nr:disulfide bond formation protein B [Hyphomicrobium nitrativorans]